MAKNQEQGFSGPLGPVTSGLLKFVDGASELTLAAHDKASDTLYRAEFSRLVPDMNVASGVVTVRYPRRPHPFTTRRHSGRMTLNPAVPWALEVDGGAGRITADLSDVDLTRLDLNGGVAHVSVVLPRPSDTVRVRITGGASNVTLRRPPGVPVRIRVTGGASALTLDSQYLQAVGMGAELTTPDFGTEAERYEIEVVGGASALTVDEG
ncbi:hypothetical protein [Streptomyces scopuliridis]|uniref:hypothetical protein n=1 Tax=Streptomyces scopuliridis TaxID=452529 RepID=UPI0036A6AB0F